MQIAIASGKGGTGKTTVAVNLAAYLAQLRPVHLSGSPVVVLADCDVEEPNAHLFLPPSWDTMFKDHVPVPEFDINACLGSDCQRCVALCRFKALAMMKEEPFPFPELCHGCGLCVEACPAGAITAGRRITGTIETGTSPAAPGIGFVQGTMELGEAMSPPLIKTVKREAARLAPENDPVLLDCPPGTACPAITAMDGSDFVVLVTEPTPFGLHDLNLAVETCRLMGLNHGVVINRDGMGDDRVKTYLDEQNIPLLACIPHSMEVARAYSRGDLLLDTPGYASAMKQLWTGIRSHISGGPHV